MDRRVIRKRLRQLEKTKPSQGTSRETLPKSPPSVEVARDVPSGGLGMRSAAPAGGAGQPESPELPEVAAPLRETDPEPVQAEESGVREWFEMPVLPRPSDAVVEEGSARVRLPNTGIVTSATLRRGDEVESITLDELIDADTRISLHGGGDAHARLDRAAELVAPPELDPTSASIEQPPAHVLASLPQSSDVYDHLFSQLSERTREAYEGDLSALAAWLELSSSRAAVGFFLSQTPERAQAIALGWLDQMQGQTPPLAPATQSRRLAALRSVLKVARGLGVVSWTLNVKAPKAASLRDTDGFDVETAKKLLAACGEGLFGLRNQVLMRLLYVHALRRVEIVRILTKHFDGRRILVHGKGFERDERKIKLVALTPKESELVTQWISEAKRGPDQQLLCGWRNGRPTDGITGHGVYAVALQLHKRAGVQVGTRPHQFRHSAVNELIDHGVSLTVAQSLLRHEDPRTTAGYYSNREDAALQASTMLEKILDGEQEE